MDLTESTDRRPIWKRGSYWLLLALIVLLVLAVWLTLDRICAPTETVPQCFGFTD